MIGMNDPKAQAERQRRQNAISLRLTLLENGYLLTSGTDGSARAATSREELHQHVDHFFDEVERLRTESPMAKVVREATEVLNRTRL